MAAFISYRGPLPPDVAESLPPAAAIANGPYADLDPNSWGIQVWLGRKTRTRPAVRTGPAKTVASYARVERPKTEHPRRCPREAVYEQFLAADGSHLDIMVAPLDPFRNISFNSVTLTPARPATSALRADSVTAGADKPVAPEPPGPMAAVPTTPVACAASVAHAEAHAKGPIV
jgi:hypothetical protein